MISFGQSNGDDLYTSYDMGDIWIRSTQEDKYGVEGSTNDFKILSQHNCKYDCECCHCVGSHRVLFDFYKSFKTLDGVCCVHSAIRCKIKDQLDFGDIFTKKSKFATEIEIGQCLWIGKINSLWSVLGKMKSSSCENISCDENMKNIFGITDDNRNELKMFLFHDVTKINLSQPGMVLEESGILNWSKTIDIKNYAGSFSIDFERNSLKFGRSFGNVSDNSYLNVRVRFLVNCFSLKKSSMVYGKLKWLGSIGDLDCVGIELDLPLDNWMSLASDWSSDNRNVISVSDLIEIDDDAYSSKFTCQTIYEIYLSDIFKSQDFIMMDYFPSQPNWTIGTPVFVCINKEERHVQHVGKLIWIGSLYSKPLAVVELGMDAELKKILMKRMISLFVPSLPKEPNKLLIPVNPKYLFKYSELDWDEEYPDDLAFVHEGYRIMNGYIRWRGVDTSNNLFYGLEMINYSPNGTNGTFFNQNLFICPHGYGVLVDLETLKSWNFSSLSSSNKIFPLITDAEYHKTHLITLNKNELKKDMSEIFSILMKNTDVDSYSIQKLVSNSTKIKNVSVLVEIVRNVKDKQIDLSHQDGLITRLVNEHQFECLELLLTNKISVSDDMDKGCNLDMALVEPELLLNAINCIKLFHKDDWSKCLNLAVTMINMCCELNQSLNDDGDIFIIGIGRIATDLTESCLCDLIECIKETRRMTGWFDITYTNELGESGIKILSTCQFWKSIDLLIKYNVEIQRNHDSYQDYKIESSIKTDYQVDSDPKSDIATNSDDYNNKNQFLPGSCSYCHVQPISMTTNCGHMYCGDCLYDLPDCHVCNARIKKRIRLYFN